ncbi:hypothetical protein BDB00DRAFT_763241 [Zychaea mexicana]|uniref:uncharacterized protein n=1 Tax=Zychaea mexicana TaxID=64656 RepID=UPI0022FE6F77|nr:uncharacterized protein BDB00DRAFT_763241 [Zychaea mexicana]KAI9493683.1 hypothetical protein BDB00DRAFT_763241 [Zychaea mexicana]
MKLYNKMNQNDTLAVDVIFCSSEKVKMSLRRSNDNFVYPIHKNINENLTITEEHFNNTFGSFRSKIENQFSEIGNKFYRFNNNKSIFVEVFNIPVLPHHKIWHSPDFDFPIEKKLIDIVVSNNKQNKDKLDRMVQLQSNLLNMTLSNDEMVIDDSSESDNLENSENNDDIPNFNERTRKRRINVKGKQRSPVLYEIESIIRHKKEKNAYLFQVKWVGYSNNDNSWLSIDMFNQKELLNAYIERHSLGIL